MTLVSGRWARIGAEHGHAFADPVRIGRQAQIERHHRRFLGAQQLQRFLAIAGNEQLIAVIGPAQLTLEPRIILDDQQFGAQIGHQAILWRRFSAASRGGSAESLAAKGRQMVKQVPIPGVLST